MSLNALRPQFPPQCNGYTEVSLWTLTLKRNKRNVGEQGLSSHLSFPRLRIAKYTPFSLRPAMVLCAENMPIHIGGMNGMLIELRWNSLQCFLLLHSQMGRWDVRILGDNEHIRNGALRASSCPGFGPFRRTATSLEHVPGHTTFSEMELLGAAASLSQIAILCWKTDSSVKAPSGLTRSLFGFSKSKVRREDVKDDSKAYRRRTGQS